MAELVAFVERTALREDVAETQAANARLARKISRDVHGNSAIRAGEVMARRARRNSIAIGRQAPLMPITVVASGGQTVGRVTGSARLGISAGGSRPVGRHGVPASALLYGSEFGSRGRYRQFGHYDPAGKWFFEAQSQSESEVDGIYDRNITGAVGEWADSGVDAPTTVF